MVFRGSARGVITVLCGVALVSGCAVNIEMVVEPIDKKAPRISLQGELIAGITRLAVLPFSDSEKPGRRVLPSPPFPENTFIEDYPIQDDGEYIAERITTYLARSAAFEITGPKQVRDILEEKGLKLPDVIDDQEALKLGRILGVEGVLFGHVTTLQTRKQWKYIDPSYVHQEIGYLNSDFKVFSVENSRMAVLANHSLNSQNLLSQPVKVVGSKGGAPQRFSGKVPAMENVIELFLTETLEPILEMKK